MSKFINKWGESTPPNVPSVPSKPNNKSSWHNMNGGSKTQHHDLKYATNSEINSSLDDIFFKKYIKLKNKYIKLKNK